MGRTVTNNLSHAGRFEKAAILVWGVIGAGLGWLTAAWSFPHNGADGSLMVALLVMFLVTWYGARQSQWLWSRIACAVWLGGALVGAIGPPTVSESPRLRPDLVELILRGFGHGEFSPVPWGLAGALLFLAVLIAMARPGKPVDSGASEGGAARDVDSEGR